MSYLAKIDAENRVDNIPHTWFAISYVNDIMEQRLLKHANRAYLDRWKGKVVMTFPAMFDGHYRVTVVQI